MAPSRAVSHARAAAGCLNHIGRTLAAVALLVALAACGSSATSVTSPSNVNRCAIDVRPFEGQVPAQGGTGTVSVAAARDCTWSASADAQWLSIRTGSSGQGDGAVEFVAAANPDPATRRGALVLNNQRAEITQAAAPCMISLGESAASFGQQGGMGTVQVRASSGMCAWTATSDANWIALRIAAGTGNGQVTFEVQPTIGPSRSATITIAGQKFSITQAEGCDYSIAPMSRDMPPAGGAGTIAITTAARCAWTASSNVDWIQFAQPSGSGPVTLGFTVAPTAGPSRTGTAVVAGHVFTVVQSQGCSYAVEPTAHSVGAGGGTLSVNVSAAAGCAWTAASEASWITIEGSSSRTGNGAIALAVAPTSGPGRTGAAVIAGQRVTVSQGAGCAYAISPDNASVGSSGGTGRVAVTTSAGCAWTASSSTSWLTITSGASGSGNGEVQYSVAATTGPGRSATMTIAGRTFTLNQGQGCSFALSPTSATIDDGGGQGTFTIRTAAGCGWTVAPSVSWIDITSPASGSGESQVRFTVAANTGPARSGAITAAGQTFTVQQGNGCSYALSAAAHEFGAAGGTASVNVRAPNGCSWTATSNASSWLTIANGSSGSGNGTVDFSAAANTGAARAGTLTIGGQTFTVNQLQGCSYGISPTTQNVPAAANTVNVSVTAPGACAWTARSNESWLIVAEGGSGTGDGAVRVDVQANPGAQRTGTVSIAEKILTIVQASGCTFTVAPGQFNLSSAASTGRVEVTAAASTCGWEASSGSDWITITAGSNGTGNGVVDFTVAANTAPGRTGAMTVAGRTVSVTQASGCSSSLSSASLPIGNAGGNSFVNVSTSAGCRWTAVSNAAWITITAGASGTGEGTVQFAIAANTTGAPRSGTMTIAGLAFTVNQE